MSMFRRLSGALLSLLLIAALPLPALAGSDRAEVSVRFERDTARLGPEDPYRAFVHFDSGSFAANSSFLEARGFEIVAEYPEVNVAFAAGSVRGFERLRTETRVQYLEANHELVFYGDTAPWATRARVAQKEVAGGPYRDADGRILDGSGIGVAIVDSGVNGLHPDFEGRLVKNYKYVGGFVETPYGDTTSGHGTHVAGIVGGSGERSKGTYTGVAPGASLYGYGTGDGINIFFSTQAFQHILANNDSFTPRIRVVNNSWGNPAGSPYDPNGIQSKLTMALVASGVTMVFAAGNGDTLNVGGNGSDDRTSATCKDPTPGVICVANYNDANTGTRSGTLSSSSSRGKKGEPHTYPDISAPGSSITAACLPPQDSCASTSTKWPGFYSTLSGTSMASPHVAGVAALLTQARPDLKPWQIESVLQDTAHKFTTTQANNTLPQPVYEPDPQNPDGTHSFDKGAGLVDVPAALRGLGISGDTDSPAATAELLSGDGGDYPGAKAADIVSLAATNEADGVRYTAQVTDVEDVGPGGRSELRLFQNVNGLAMTTSVFLGSSGATAGYAGPDSGQCTPSPATACNFNAPPTEVSRDVEADTVTFFVPFDRFGTQAAPVPENTPAHNIWFGSYTRETASGQNQGLLQDAAPGGIGLTTANTAPEFAAPYTVRPTTLGAPTPLPLPTEGPTPDPVVDPGTRFYFHRGSSRSNTADNATGTPASYDDEKPTATDSAVAADVPLVQSTSAQPPFNLVDPMWTGELPAPASAVTVDFWQRALYGDALGDVSYTARIFQGNTLLASVNFSGTPVGSDEFTRVTQTLSGISLPAGPISIALKGTFIDSGAVTAIAYDSAQHPSGFFAKLQAIDPDPTPTPTPDPAPRAVGDVLFEDSASILAGSPATGFGAGVSESEFLLNGCQIGDAQGLDGHVFELERPTSAEAVVTVDGESDLPAHDLDLQFYDPACESSGDSVATAAANELGFIPEGTKWIVANLFTGADVTATVKIYTGVEADPVPLATSLEFVERPTEGQYNDDATFSARLTDEDMFPIAGAEITFRLTSTDAADAVREWTAVTDAQGVATGTTTLTETPGTYQVGAEYDGAPETHEASSNDGGDFVVAQEDTLTELQIGQATGKGKNRSRGLEATVSDVDSTLGISGLVVTFTCDGSAMGSATTDDQGRASLTAPHNCAAGSHVYEATFGGDTFYLGSSDIKTS